MTDLTQTLDRLEALLTKATAAAPVRDPNKPAWPALFRDHGDWLQATLGAREEICDTLPTLIASVRALLAEREGMESRISEAEGLVSEYRHQVSMIYSPEKMGRRRDQFLMDILAWAGGEQ